MAHAAPQSSHGRGMWVALALMVVVILGTVIGIILHSSGAPTHHPSVTHSAPVRPSPAKTVTPAPTHKPTPITPPAHHIKHAVKTVTTYTVRTGDTLWGIASHIYHNPLDWHKLYQLNHNKIGGNPNLIHTGIVLQLE